ncbi:helix-turn-helix domain-containing protein [Crassaminicella profunda]|uniref:helix-turn-helix domain-containing protein n=1 Tax=Crassaminicella profunda TaxID=1286698 RepID=UPI001CA75839|nr:helix-turn-helix transcriptional regulator [Crassaminicella profunda]QZY56494.1 helix-turn-helix domain-containing protein [Crassaminicella profunda]
MSTIYKELGKKIREYRKTKHYSTAEFADRLNVSSGLINNIENGRYDVFKLELLHKIIEALDISSTELIDPSYINFNQVDINKHSIDISLKALCNTSNQTPTFLKDHISTLIDLYLSIASDSQFDEESMNIVIDHIQHEINFCKKLHTHNNSHY